MVPVHLMKCCLISVTMVFVPAALRFRLKHGFHCRIYVCMYVRTPIFTNLCFIILFVLFIVDISCS